MLTTTTPARSRTAPRVRSAAPRRASRGRCASRWRRHTVSSARRSPRPAQRSSPTTRLGADDDAAASRRSSPRAPPAARRRAPRSAARSRARPTNGSAPRRPPPERTAGRRGAAARRERARDGRAARDCLVVAPGRILDPLLAALGRCRSQRGSSSRSAPTGADLEDLTRWARHRQSADSSGSTMRPAATTGHGARCTGRARVAAF